MKIQFQSTDLIVFESSLFRTTTTLIIGEEYILLVDPNWLPIELDFIEKQIEAISAGKEKYLLFTHSDYDHIIGFGRFKHYKTIASQNFVDNEAIESILKQIQKFDDENYIKRCFEIEYPRIDMVIGNETYTSQLGEDTYQFMQARGHNKDGLISFNKFKGILIAGDYLSNIEFPYIYDSWQRYMDTLSSFKHLIDNNHVGVLIPGHGDVTTEKEAMDLRIRESVEYLDSLRSAVSNEIQFDEEKLFQRYDFPIIMKKFHDANVRLVGEEFA